MKQEIIVKINASRIKRKLKLKKKNGSCFKDFLLLNIKVIKQKMLHY